MKCCIGSPVSAYTDFVYSDWLLFFCKPTIPKKAPPLARTARLLKVPKRGLEPPRPKRAHDPESCASTSSATWAKRMSTNHAQRPQVPTGTGAQSIHNRFVTSIHRGSRVIRQEGIGRASGR